MLEKCSLLGLFPQVSSKVVGLDVCRAPKGLCEALTLVMENPPAALAQCSFGAIAYLTKFSE